MSFHRTLRFDYKLSAKSSILMVVTALVVTFGIGYIAYAKPNIGIFKTLTTLFSPQAPVLFFWALFVLCVFSTVMALTLAVKSSKSLSFLELGPTAALLPSASFAMSPISIPYGAIRAIQVVNIQKHKMAVISSSVAEVRLLSNFFSVPGEFETFLLELKNRQSI